MTVEPLSGPCVGDRLEIHYCGEEWAALFVDGKLHTIGDSYVAEERALIMCGVKTVSNEDGGSDVLRGGTGRDNYARTLEEVAAYRAEREQREATAAHLREKAAQYLAEAEAVEKGTMAP